jgi:hypothetical protein
MSDPLTLEQLNYLADEAQDGTGFLQLDTATALDLIAAARAHLKGQGREKALEEVLELARSLITDMGGDVPFCDLEDAIRALSGGKTWGEMLDEISTLKAENERLRKALVSEGETIICIAENLVYDMGGDVPFGDLVDAIRARAALKEGKGE